MLSYIARHERAAENREFITKASQIYSQVDEETGIEMLFLGHSQIEHGDRLQALFPSGWENITFRFRNCERTGAKWYIATDAFANYSPVGLFAANLRKVDSITKNKNTVPENETQDVMSGLCVNEPEDKTIELPMKNSKIQK